MHSHVKPNGRKGVGACEMIFIHMYMQSATLMTLRFCAVECKAGDSLKARIHDAAQYELCNVPLSSPKDTSSLSEDRDRRQASRDVIVHSCEQISSPSCRREAPLRSTRNAMSSQQCSGYGLTLSQCNTIDEMCPRSQTRYVRASAWGGSFTFAVSTSSSKS